MKMLDELHTLLQNEKERADKNEVIFIGLHIFII